jgi:hypothetical protein
MRKRRMNVYRNSLSRARSGLPTELGQFFEASALENSITAGLAAEGRSSNRREATPPDFDFFGKDVWPMPKGNALWPPVKPMGQTGIVADPLAGCQRLFLRIQRGLPRRRTVRETRAMARGRRPEQWRIGPSEYARD